MFENSPTFHGTLLLAILIAALFFLVGYGLNVLYPA